MRANMETFVKCKREESWKEKLPKTNGINLIPIVEQFKGNQLLTDSFYWSHWSLSFWPFHRATVKKGVTFRTATPTNSLLWDITLDMGADGVISVVCQRKAPIPGKRQVFFPNGYVQQLSLDSPILFKHFKQSMLAFICVPVERDPDLCAVEGQH